MLCTLPNLVNGFPMPKSSQGSEVPTLLSSEKRLMVQPIAPSIQSDSKRQSTFSTVFKRNLDKGSKLLRMKLN